MSKTQCGLSKELAKSPLIILTIVKRLKRKLLWQIKKKTKSQGKKMKTTT